MEPYQEAYPHQFGTGGGICDFEDEHHLWDQ